MLKELANVLNAFDQTAMPVPAATEEQISLKKSAGVFTTWNAHSRNYDLWAKTQNGTARPEDFRFNIPKNGTYLPANARINAPLAPSQGFDLEELYRQHPELKLAVGQRLTPNWPPKPRSF